MDKGGMVLGRPAALLFLAALGGAGGLKAPTLRAAASPRSSASSALFDGDDGAPPRAVRERLAGAEGVPGARRWPEPSDAPTRTPTLSAAPYPVHDDLYVRPNSPFARDWAWGDDAGGAAPGAVSLGASNGWCLTDAEAKELGELRAGLASRLGHCSIPEQTRVLTALDVAYQVRNARPGERSCTRARSLVRRMRSVARRGKEGGGGGGGGGPRARGPPRVPAPPAQPPPRPPPLYV